MFPNRINRTTIKLSKETRERLDNLRKEQCEDPDISWDNFMEGLADFVEETLKEEDTEEEQLS